MTFTDNTRIVELADIHQPSGLISMNLSSASNDV